MKIDQGVEVLKIQEDVSNQAEDHPNRKWAMPDRKSEILDLHLRSESATGLDHPTEYLQI